jgi:hypothetical protein
MNVTSSPGLHRMGAAGIPASGTRSDDRFFRLIVSSRHCQPIVFN